MISLIWTRNSSFLSKFIRWIFNENVSHFAWLLDNKLVFHSNLIGVHLTWFDWFSSKNEIIYRIDLHLSLEEQEKFYQQIIKGFHTQRYDYAALIYFGYRGLLKKFFCLPMPKTNAWGRPQAWLCEELFEPMKEKVLLPADLDIITPEQLYKAVTDGNLSNS